MNHLSLKDTAVLLNNMRVKSKKIFSTAIFSLFLVSWIAQSDSNGFCIENAIPKDMFYPESAEIHPWGTCEALKWNDIVSARSTANNCNTRIRIADTLKIKLEYADGIPWDNWSTELNLDASQWDIWVIIFTADPWPMDTEVINYDDIDCEPAIGSKTVNLFGTVLAITLEWSDVEIIKDNIVNVSWTTSSEVGSDYFNVMRNWNNSDETSIAVVDAAWNFDGSTSYSVQDTVPYSWNYSYSLEEVDNSWKIQKEYLWSVRVENSTINDIQINPNPTAWDIYLRNFEQEDIHSCTLFPITNMKQWGGVLMNIQDWKIDISTFPDGMYGIVIENIYGQRVTKRIIKSGE